MIKNSKMQDFKSRNSKILSRQSVKTMKFDARNS